MATLLLVDDDDAFSSLLTVALRDEGHTVPAAPDAERALYELGEYPVDAQLVDIRLPGMSGLELIREVSLRGATPMIAVTTPDNPDDIVTGLGAAGIDRLIQAAKAEPDAPVVPLRPASGG